MVIGPDYSVHSRAKNITLLLYSFRGGPVTISVDKPGLTPRVSSFTADPISKNAVIFDVYNTNETYTVSATDNETDTCTVTIEPRLTQGLALTDVETEIKSCIEAINPTERIDERYKYQDVLLEDTENFRAHSRGFNFPLQSFGKGEILGSRYGEYLLQVTYPNLITGSDIQDLYDAVESMQWSSGILTVISDAGSVEYFEGFNTSVLSMRLYALYDAQEE